MNENPEREREHFTLDELATMWRGHLTQEELTAIKQETEDRINAWVDNLPREEADAWVEAYVEDLERELQQKLGDSENRH
jgi:DNA-directed RNA polymerase specialized sigma24 family protein